MNKLLADFQKRYSDRQIYDRRVLNGISPSVKLHDELENPCSSAAACLNVLGSIKNKPSDLLSFLNSFGLNASEILAFPSGTSLGGETYDDAGPVVFEWIGPKQSPINEKGGSRGQNKTSVDAFVACRVQGKPTQVLIEWKFTEKYMSGAPLHKFAGKRGIERLRRYSSVLASLRGTTEFPLAMRDEDKLGLYDLGYEPIYQLLRMTLLAKTTTPLIIGTIQIEDYRILHLIHSENKDLAHFTEAHCAYSSGLRDSIGMTLHELWANLLAENEKARFIGGYWDKALSSLSKSELRDYLIERYG